MNKLWCNLLLVALGWMSITTLAHSEIDYSLPSEGELVKWQSTDSVSNDNEYSEFPHNQKIYKKQGFSKNKFHQYAGLGTFALATISALMPKDKDAYKYAANLAAVSAVTTVSAGAVAHWNDYNMSDGITDPDNLHVIFAGLGAIATISAAVVRPDSGDAELSALGALSMGIAVKMTW